MRLPAFLIEETEVCASGAGKAFEIIPPIDGSDAFLVTLGITRVVEQESLDLTLHASADAVVFGPKPILTFPQKFYVGTYQLILDLRTHPEVRYLRAAWKVNRWGRGSLKPLFGLYLVVQTVTI